MLKDNPRASGV